MIIVSQILVFAFVLYELVKAIRNLSYQREWNAKKALYRRIDPAITKAQLCEQYVMFRQRNNCEVDF